ncbi:Ig-like domain-containing protein, partial [Singulisphaera rosea]
ITQGPGVITVTFSKPVVLSSITAADLVFTNLPTGVTVTSAGAPIGVDDPTFPTVVSFPISINSSAGTLANGSYTYKIQGAITAQAGQQLTPSNPISFTLSDTTAPRIANTTITGRTITIQFNEPMRESTITAANLQVIRAGGANTPFGTSSQVVVSNDPNFKINYDPTTNTATLDLSAIAQTSLPTDHYEIVVRTGASDMVGNTLNGSFSSGVFPSGSPTNGTTAGLQFVQDLGVQTLGAPIITTLTLQPTS